MKILSIDGGGIRGIIPALILKEIEETTGKPICDLFDLIAGTSTGGLIALGLTIDNGFGKPKYTAHDLVELYRNEGKNIFDRSVWHKIKSIGNLREEKYPKDGLINVADNYFEDKRLKDVLTDVIIPSYETERRIPWLFKSKNAKNPNKPDYDFPIKDVALATASAPTYFEPHKINVKNDDYLSFIDGGVYANNPALCAYTDAKNMFKKKDEEIFMLSLGTGQLTRRYYYENIKDWGLLDWAQPILSCVFDGVSDTVDYQLSNILNTNQYFRLQVELEEGNDDMDDASNTNLRVLQLLAENLIHQNHAKIKKITKFLNA